jgi:hypothetical protein
LQHWCGRCGQQTEYRISSVDSLSHGFLLLALLADNSAPEAFRLTGGHVLNFYFMFTLDERDLIFLPRIDLPILSVVSPRHVTDTEQLARPEAS